MPALVRVVQLSSSSLTWLRRLLQIGRSELQLGSGVFDFKVIAESLERAHLGLRALSVVVEIRHGSDAPRVFEMRRPSCAPNPQCDTGNGTPACTLIAWDHRDDAIDTGSNRGAPNGQVLLPDRSGCRFSPRCDGDNEPSRDDRRLMSDARGEGEGRGAIRAL